MYEAIVTLHILSGMAWVGAGIVFLWGSHNIRTERGDAEVLEVRDRLEKATTAITWTPFLAIGTGIAQVLMSEQHDWSHLWVVLAVVLAVLALTLGGVNDAGTKKAQKESEESGEMSAGVLDRSMRLLWVEMAVMAAIVALMVIKPV